ncbi:DUF485 domain-containing protein [Austwickia chelonae]|uniref:DUF485 domain-containing protein n=1 Tax=Austwickia chelonae TaxID=100225 RepID=UPI003D322304
MNHPQGTPSSNQRGSDPTVTYLAVQNTDEFRELRRRFRRFAFPATAFFLIWYFLYVLLAAYAPGFMSIKVVGAVNIGLLLGLGQFVTTFALTIAYVRWAGRSFDPRADAIRDHMHLSGGR